MRKESLGSAEEKKKSGDSKALAKGLPMEGMHIQKLWPQDLFDWTWVLLFNSAKFSWSMISLSTYHFPWVFNLSRSFWQINWGISGRVQGGLETLTSLIGQKFFGGGGRFVKETATGRSSGTFWIGWIHLCFSGSFLCLFCCSYFWSSALRCGTPVGQIIIFGKDPLRGISIA